MNAIAHSVEALYAPNANPIVSLLAARRHPRARSIAADRRRLACQSRRTRRDALRRVALRYGARRGEHGSPSQAVSHARSAGRSGLHATLTFTPSCCAHAAAFNREAAPDAMLRGVAAARWGLEDAAQGLRTISPSASARRWR